MADQNPFAQFASPVAPAGAPSANNPFASFAPKPETTPAGENPFAAFKPQAYEDRNFLQKHVTDRLTKGGLQLAADLSSAAAGSAALQAMDLAPYYEKIDAGTPYSEVVPTDQTGTAAVNLSPGDLNRLRQYAGGSADERAQLRAETAQSVVGNLQDRAGPQAAANAIPSNPKAADFAAAFREGRYLDSAKVLLRNPSLITDTATESIPSTVPGLALGTINPALGATALGATTGAQEYGNSLINYLQDHGVNVADQKAVEKALADTKLLMEADKFARARALPQALVNAASGGIAGKTLVSEKLIANELGREAANVFVAQPLAQGTLGGVGEATAQIASTGKITDPADIAMNVIGEFGGAPVEAVGFGRERIFGQTPSPDIGVPFSKAGLDALAGTEAPAHPGEDTSGGLSGITPGNVAKPVGPETPATTRPQIGLEDLPEDPKTIKAKAGDGQNPEAVSLARSAAIKRNVARKYEAQGKPADAAAMRQAAESDLAGAVEKGYVKPEPKAEAVAKKAPPTVGLPPEMVPPKAPVGETIPGVQPQQVGQNGFPQVSPVEGTSPTITAYRGYNRASQKSVYAGAAEPIAGVGEYYAFQPGHAREYGPDLEVIESRAGKTLVIKSDTDWQNLTKQAGWEFPNPIGRPAEEVKTMTAALKKLVQSQGYDSIMVAWNDNSQTDTDNNTGAKIKTLRNVFGHPTLVRYENAPEVARLQIPAEAPVKASPFARMLTAMASRIHDYTWPHMIDLKHLEYGKTYLLQTGPDAFATMMQEKFIPLVQELQERLMPKSRIIIDASRTSALARQNGTDRANGSFTGFTDGSIIIWLNPDSKGSSIEKLSTIIHELGHAVAWYNFWDAGTATQQALYQAYQQFLVRAGQQDIMASFTEMLSASKLFQMVKVEGDAAIIRESRIAAMEQLTRRWYSFDEWMAEGFTRWATSSRTPLTIVEKYFKKVATAIKKIYELFGLEKNGNGLVDPALKDFFESVLAKHDAGAPTSTPSAALHAHLDGVAQIARELDEPVDIEGPVPSLATVGTRNLNPSFMTPAQNAAIDKYNWWIGKTWGLIQIAEKNPHIIGLRNFIQNMRAFHISKMELVSRADFRLREWRKLGKEMATNLSKFMYALDTMEYLPVGANMRWPTAAEFQALVSKYKLDARAVALYTKMKDDFSHVLDRIEAAWIRDAAASISDPIKLQAEMRKIGSEMAAMRSRPYFPHERFGDWTLTARLNNKVVFFQQFASLKQATQAAEAYARSNPGHDVSTGKLSDEGQQFRGLPPSLLKSIAQRLNLTSAQRKNLEDVILSLAPSNSAAKRFKRRANTPGYSLDGMRSYAAYFMSMSGHIARLEYNGPMTQNINDVMDSARQMRGIYAGQAVSKRMGIGEWMQRLYDYMNSSKSEWQGLRSFAFLWYLGYNVSSALTNLTQVPMVALPYLSSRFGDIKTLNQLRKAYTDLQGVYRMKPGALKPELEDALKEAIKQGFIDESMAKELASASNGGTLIAALPGTAAQRGLMNFANVGALPFQMVEKLNRRVTFVSAFRMAQDAQADPSISRNARSHLAKLAAANGQLMAQLLAQGWTSENAIAFLAGRDAVEKSQFEYAKWARPAFMRGKIGTLFTFFMFKQNMLWFLKNSPGAGRAWLMLFAGAGLMGLPGAEDLDDLIKYLAYKLFGKDFNPQLEFRKYVHSLGGDPDLVMHGLGYKTLGLQPLGDALGIPVPGIDLSSRIGMGQIIPGMQEATAVSQDSFDEKLGKVAEAAVGPAFGVPLTILKAVSSNDPDTFKNFERQLPTAFKNLLKAYRFATAGETDKSGAQLTNFDMTDTKARMEILAQAIGFTPERVAAKREASTAEFEASEYWALRRGELFTDYAYAIRMRDREAIADVRNDIRDYNREAPFPKLRISSKDLLTSLKRRVKEKAKKEAERNSPFAAGINQLYPAMSEPGTN